MMAAVRFRMAAALTLTAALAASAPGQPSPTRTVTPVLTPGPGVLGKVKFTQKPGAQVPLDLVFRDEQGRSVRLGDLVGDRPIILNLVYYDCPLLCNKVLDSLVRSLNVLDDYTVGDDFDVLSVSISPTESPELARAKEASIMRAYHFASDRAARGWHFLTSDDQRAIDTLAESVGFTYTYNPKTKLYAHAAGIVFLTPDGRISRYVYGISYPARDLRLALADASNGEIGGILEQMLLLCYHYDPSSGTYSFAIMNVIRVFGTLTALGLGSFMALMFFRDRRRAAAPAVGFADAPPAPSDR